MKVYQKPALYAESYALAEHISQSCVFQTNFGNQWTRASRSLPLFRPAVRTASACLNSPAKIRKQRRLKI